MKFFGVKEIIIALAVIAVLVMGGLLFSHKNTVYFVGQAEIISPDPKISAVPLPLPQKLSNPPTIIKAIYVTGYSAGSPKYLNYLTNLFKTTQINAVVVDVKGSDGVVTYPARISDIDTLVRFFHSQNIYVIGRIAVFEDPIYSNANPTLAIYNKTETIDQNKPVLWQDNNGLGWLDPASKDVWARTVLLAKNALSHGFDEINFDYVRFPSDGATGEAGFPVYNGVTPKADVIKSFFQYLRINLAGQKISADLFGQTTTNTDDMGIGQLLENAFENFDYISPMVYPSHYINGFMGFDNPADHPYEIINYSMITALNREKVLPFVVPKALLAKFRPWLQDFNMGADYTADMVDQEIKATQDGLGNNYSGFMLWNPSNIYTESAVPKL